MPINTNLNQPWYLVYEDSRTVYILYAQYPCRYCKV